MNLKLEILVFEYYKGFIVSRFFCFHRMLTIEIKFKMTIDTKCVDIRQDVLPANFLRILRILPYDPPVPTFSKSLALFRVIWLTMLSSWQTVFEPALAKIAVSLSTSNVSLNMGIFSPKCRIAFTSLLVIVPFVVTKSWNYLFPSDIAFFFSLTKNLILSLLEKNQNGDS